MTEMSSLLTDALKKWQALRKIGATEAQFDEHMDEVNRAYRVSFRRIHSSLFNTITLQQEAIARRISERGDITGDTVGREAIDAEIAAMRAHLKATCDELARPNRTRGYCLECRRGVTPKIMAGIRARKAEWNKKNSNK